VSNAETPEAAGLQVPGSAHAASATKKIVQISIFVSRKLSKLFAAMEFQNEGTAIRWTVVSIPDEFPRIEGATKGAKRPEANRPIGTVTRPGQRCLNRIEIPQDRLRGSLNSDAGLFIDYFRQRI